MAQAARELFAERLGETLEVRLRGERSTKLRLDRIEDFGAADGVRFSVFLSGPGEVFLPQGIYTMALPSGDAVDLFIVPVGRDGERYQYEAAFNREGA